jgi:hypothetical protein
MGKITIENVFDPPPEWIEKLTAVKQVCVCR